ncbi:MAG: lipid-A-disaccharide synthase [Muribaculaceae bacterium]|nr:lipid-A-disaccharide synthase [Muribaculaceae bacterium]
MKYFIIAGEASGDLHASMLISAIKKNDSRAEFRFLGGDLMCQSAGAEPIMHYRKMAYMGFLEVAKHIKEILSIMTLTKRSIAEYSPDAVILVDYPSFNLKIAKYAKSLGHKVFYYISPKVWAWKEFRVKQIKKYVDKMYSILPFEPRFYDKYDYAVKYVGNPSVGEINEALYSIPCFDAFADKHLLDREKPIISLLPGSRRSEIENNLPEMLKAAYKFPDFQVVISGAPGINTDYYSKVIKTEGSYDVPPIITGDTYSLVRNSKASLVTSGTATLETALLGTPQVACYRAMGSRWVYWIFSHILEVKYVTLPNLIADAPIIPELLLHNCNSEKISKTLEPLLSHSPWRDEMLTNYKKMREILGNEDSAGGAATDIVETLKK